MSLEGNDKLIERFANDRQFGIAVIDHGFPGVFLTRAASDEVGAGRRGFQTCGIHGGKLNMFSPSHHSRHGLIEQSLDRLCGENFSRGFLESREVGYQLHLDGGSEITAITQKILQATVIELEKVLQNQTGKESPLGQFFGTVLMRILRENLCGDASSLK